MDPAPIAVVGIGCRVAGNVNSPAEFWSFLMDGRSHVGEVPEERWEPYLHRDPRNAAVLKEITRSGTFLDDLPGFDAEFFGVSPREAELMDPQQRLALEVSWEALEHAGISPRSLAGGDAAVLMGVNSDDYGKLIMEDLPGIEAWTGIGTSLCGIANRVSHLLDLRGPSVALDAACAASLVAVHQACQMLRAGETSLALAGGVSALIGPGLIRVLDEAGATAPDGRCKTFDSAADGYGRGEGAGVVVLKRLADAHRDGDRVLAVVRGGAVAQDGRTVGIMSPNGDAQADMFRRACEISGVAPDSVGYVEAHGTGTPTGDPVEVLALAAVYGAGRPDDARCRIGSVKPNVGHLEGGAGVVGLIKTVLALQHKTIPADRGAPRAHARGRLGGQRPSGAHRSRAVGCAATLRGARRCAATATAAPSPTCSSKRRPRAPTAVATHNHDRCRPSCRFRRSREARLVRQADALADRLRAVPGQPAHVAATLWARRAHDHVRAAVIADAPHELVAGLDAVARGENVARRGHRGGPADGPEERGMGVLRSRLALGGHGLRAHRDRARLHRRHRRDRRDLSRRTRILCARGTFDGRARRYRPGAGADLRDAGQASPPCCAPAVSHPLPSSATPSERSPRASPQEYSISGKVPRWRVTGPEDFDP